MSMTKLAPAAASRSAAGWTMPADPGRRRSTSSCWRARPPGSRPPPAARPILAPALLQRHHRPARRGTRRFPRRTSPAPSPPRTRPTDCSAPAFSPQEPLLRLRLPPGRAAGYRYLRFADRLGVTEDLMSIDPNSPRLHRSRHAAERRGQLRTKNEFNGFDLGLTPDSTAARGAWTSLAKVAVGANHQAVDINGATTVAVPGTPPFSSRRRPARPVEQQRPSQQQRILRRAELDVKRGLPDHARGSGRRSATRCSTGPTSSAPARPDRHDHQPRLLPPAVTPVAGPQRPAPSLPAHRRLGAGHQPGTGIPLLTPRRPRPAARLLLCAAVASCGHCARPA